MQMSRCVWSIVQSEIRVLPLFYKKMEVMGQMKLAKRLLGCISC